MEEDIAPKGVQKPRRTSQEFSKRKLWSASHPQCRTSFAWISGSHSSWTLNQVQLQCSNFNSHNHHGNPLAVCALVAGNSINPATAANSRNFATTT
jgi:hypothetical protein